MQYLYKIEFYSATKKNEMLSLAGKWMELKNIILGKVCQAQKAKNCMFSLVCRVIGHGSHAKGRTHTGRIRKGKETYNLKVFDVPSVEEQIK
jgi:hypothetical protein